MGFNFLQIVGFFRGGWVGIMWAFSFIVGMFV